MRFLPYENVLLKSPLTESQVEIRLKGFVEPRQFRFTSIFSKAPAKPYEGEINENRFAIRRIIGYRNSFLPRIEGVVKYESDQATIHVKMRLHIAVLVFMCIWFGGVSIACIAVLLAGKFSGPEAIPYGMLLFGYVLTLGAFKAESIRSKRDLAELFDAEIEEL